MGDDDLTKSALGRMVKLGGLAGRVGASLLANKVAGLARPEARREAARTEALVRNAVEVVETLGQLKGAAMKVGQMLSLHEGLLPAEVSEVLRSLQKEAPRVPFEVMEAEIRGEVDDFDALFRHLDPKAFGAASIGQVYRATLHDGRHVAVKIQYPEIDYVVRADLKNLRRVMKSLFAMFSETDFEPLWLELHERLEEELDYTHEAEAMHRMAELHANVPGIVVPRVVPEASSRRMLTMELEEGIPADRACSEAFDQTLRDRWGVELFHFMLRGLFEHRFVHADPNLANFAFLEDGRVVVYDFGCVKQVPDALAVTYARVALAAMDRHYARIPPLLEELGIQHKGGFPVSSELTTPYAQVFEELYRVDPPFRFGEDDALYEKLIELGMSNWSAATDIEFPRDLIFVNRALAGHLGNLRRLQATGPWRSIIEYYTKPFAEDRADRPAVPEGA